MPENKRDWMKDLDNDYEQSLSSSKPTTFVVMDKDDRLKIYAETIKKCQNIILLR